MSSYRNCIVVLIMLFFIADSAFGQHVLRRRNPDGWFSILVPAHMKNHRRLADVDGGFYDASDMRISYTYWAYKNVPNHVRNTRTHWDKLVMVCPQSKKTRVFRALVGKQKAIIQACLETGASNFRYLYFIHIPKLDVYDGEGFDSGNFTLAINYDNRRYKKLAAIIGKSLKFGRFKPKT